MLSELRNQFKLKNFGYHDCSTQQFYKTEWSENYRKIFWVWRLFSLSYWLAWFISSLVLYDNPLTWWMKLTNWGMVVTIIYFVISFIVSTYGIFNSLWVKPMTPHPLQIISRDVERETSSIDNNQSNCSENNLKWFHIAVWIFFELSFGLALIITISYWILLKPKFNAFSVNHHLINSVILFVDLFINAIPVRILHFYHLTFFSIVYSLFALTLYGVGYEEAIYPVLNWRTNFQFSLILSLTISFIAAPLLHFLIYLLFSLKKHILQQITRDNHLRQALSESEADPNSPKKQKVLI